MKKLLPALISLTFVFNGAIAAKGFVAEQDLRIKEGEFYYSHTDLSYFFPSWSVVTPFVGARFLAEIKSDWKYFSRFHGGFNLGFKGGFGKLSARSRFEFTPGKVLGTLDTDDDYRLRQRIKYDLPFSFTAWKIKPNVFDELFFDATEGFEYNRNRLGLGLGAKIGKRFKPALYYFKEFKKSSDWKGKNVFGFAVKIAF
jgi:hypothetical protein